MTYVISLCFDEATEEIIKAVWEELHIEGISSKLHLGSYRPHVTLAVCESLDITAFKQYFAQAVAEQSPFSIQLSHIGFFQNNPLVLFYGVTVTKAIFSIRDELLTTISKCGEGLELFYNIDMWTPHCTLARDLDMSKLTHAISICEKYALPSKIIANRISVVDTLNELELVNFYFS